MSPFIFLLGNYRSPLTKEGLGYPTTESVTQIVNLRLTLIKA
jgi:hypothetical protein